MNPDIIVLPTEGMTDTEYILYALYQQQVATSSLLFALFILVLVFIAANWFLPKFWHKSDDKL